jgi:hypothetical protein
LGCRIPYTIFGVRKLALHLTRIFLINFRRETGEAANYWKICDRMAKPLECGGLPPLLKAAQTSTVQCFEPKAQGPAFCRDSLRTSNKSDFSQQKLINRQLLCQLCSGSQCNIRGLQ